jgi:hypothetical protein
MSVASGHVRAIDAHVICQLAHPAFALFFVVIVVHGIVAASAFEHRKVVDGYAVARGPATSTDFIVMVLWKFFFFATGGNIMTPDGGCPRSSRLPQIEPPVPGDDKGDVEEIKGHHSDRLPQMQFPVNDEAHAEGSRDEKEADVANEALARDLEWANQSHGARDNGRDETCSTDKLAYSQTRSVSAEGGKGREDIGTAIAKGKQCHASQALAHAQHARNCIEVDAEEVARGDANGAEEKGEPKRHEDEGKGLRMREATVIEGQVGYDAGFFIGAVCAHKGALVSGVVNEATLLVLDGQVPLLQCANYGVAVCSLRLGPC